MCKKINQDAITIKRLIDKGIKQAKIAKLLGLTRQKVSYWAKKDYPTQKKGEDERDIKIIEKEKKIKEIEKMSLIEYLDYLNGRNNKIEEGIADDNSETTMDEIEDRLKKLEEITKNNKNIKYNIKFNSKVNA